ncbi:ribonuclease P protein subunit p21 [Patella vulgata]|uniref:ribonuclease P protein subunit p21 n=1 Tax=Patella vulgata TaxID=6465 RepID=UPI00218018D3|nr:ribonuclease P protein subunit p21 [Patella vulgata]
MAKKKGSLVHKEIYQRINFLYQAAHQALTTSPSDLSLCRFYIKTLRAITQRQVLRLHPYIKRSICKKCCVLLVPGITMSVRIKANGEKYSEITCLDCGKKCKFLNRKNYQPWFENPEAWMTV